MVTPSKPTAEWPGLEGYEDSLSVFAIYEHPLDYPRHFVVRRWLTQGDGKLYADVVPRLAESLNEARELIPSERVCVGRDPTDDPTLCETWL
ncbi:MAG: hypothetical protein JRD89_03000 [Deltaproteobacteria bacterium]|nr:hypothetical protein [Deltaproteobacteria bacterium]